MAETKFNPKQAFGAGAVLQVVTATTTTQKDFTTTGRADTNLTATITPRDTNSKILVIVNQAGFSKDATAGGGLTLTLLRGAVDLIAFDFAHWYNETGQKWGGGAGCNYLDSPATTSPVTYKTQGNLFSAQGTTSVQNTGTSTITLIEIAG